MTIAAGVVTTHQVVVAADTLVVTKDPGGPYVRRLWQQKVGAYSSPSGDLLIAYAGYRLHGLLPDLYQKGLAILAGKLSFQSLIEMFAETISPELTNRSIADGQPQPAEFILGAWWAGGSPELALVRPHEVSQPDANEVVAIGGQNPWKTRPPISGAHVKGAGTALTNKLLQLLAGEIEAHPAKIYDFPLFWAALIGADKWNSGFVDADLVPVGPPSTPG